MKKILHITIITLLFKSNVFSQVNTFPTEGNTGIGTLVPPNRLSIFNTPPNYGTSLIPVTLFGGSNPEFGFSDFGNSNGNNITLRLGSNNGTYYDYGAYIKAIQGTGIDRYKLEFGTSFSTPANAKMLIDFNGNVGIGTPTPQSLLHIGNNIKYGPENGISLGGNTEVINDFVSNIYSEKTDDGRNGLLHVNTRKSGIGWGDIILAEYGGRVGIGTTNPTQKLEIYNGSVLVNYPRTSSGSIVPIAVGTQYYNGNSSRGLAGLYHIESGSSGFGQSGSLGLFTSVNDESPTEKMRISNVGNVGIGTTTPASKLDIQGANGLTIFSNDGISATFRGRTGDNSSQIRFHDNANNLSAIFGHVGNELRFYTGGANQRMVITGGGNVGIGTNGPSATLEVENGNGSPEINARGSVNPLHVSTSTTNNVRTKLQSIGSESAGYIGTETNHQLRIIVANDPKVALNSNGNLGIGTLYPNSKLDVKNGKIIAGTTNATGGSVVLESQYDQAGTYGSLSVLGTNYSSGGWILGYGITPKPGVFNSFLSSTLASIGRSGIAVESDLRFLTSSAQSLAIGNDVTMVERMKITNEGNVGIGTTSPTRKLEVFSSTNDIAYFRDNSTASEVSIRGDLKQTIFDFGNRPLQVQFNSIPSFTMNTSGDMGIGVTSPAQKLHINGNSMLSGTNPKQVYDWSGIAAFSTGIFGSTTNNTRYSILTNSVGEALSVNYLNGNVTIGTSQTLANYKLSIGGDMIAERVVVKLQSNWPDFVFKKNYGLRSLEQIEQFINQNSHLPEIPSAQEVIDKGIDVEQMNTKLLQKVEELTLYLIEQNKEIKNQSQELTSLKKELLQLKDKK